MQQQFSNNDVVSPALGETKVQKSTVYALKLCCERVASAMFRVPLQVDSTLAAPFELFRVHHFVRQINCESNLQTYS
jgi:hypothetical protein